MPLPRITAGQAEVGDVVLAEDHDVYQYEGNGQWSSMALVPTVGGPPWQPRGELVLLARDGRPAAADEPGHD